MLGKKRKIGRKLEEISIGEKLTLSEKIEDKDLLLYLGLTDDANPLYIQHDYASQTPYKKPIVPSIMLNGMINSAISKYLPGPGSHVIKQEIEYLKPVYHYSSIQFLLEIINIDEQNHMIEIKAQATNEEDETVLIGKLLVSPPHRMQKIDGQALDNF
ncbi:3-hydroxybutyryl-CoA dehydratase [Cytobacillus horneckiae]|uniref:Enoyl-CoA hydratase n=1 Tax=Cytobacillus horneckiae TaxID=549687 RepID=A0A2N0ZMG4_9BACI|nr:MaoC/PaaZ C-terminal domain-containing protein [Cytobacillus horneckiae]NRG48477.1 MaoC family dehydratase N-terminal domain-containing protein [Bacillus sp. CRN 9]MBN6887967.1 MaoC family dehydratase N-terminal domain-containing protein [Cytobacillus horneckiae]MCM3179622.1 MaoC family dehydratase N-terminal domain-containing protein [Cytobacillus horneckiae]MEC1155067.1 MaoC/PaaZ C-terminal domain-containing protein [Cytobacillus horneckiae]MED2936027.1 MaoC/PaaZ C-terminal domain-contain